MIPKAIYILGSGHSGSTILQYLLAGNKNSVGLGELRHMASNNYITKNITICACGQNADECSLWSKLKPFEKKSEIEWYANLINVVSKLYPQKRYFIDSSKTLDGLKPWLTLKANGDISEIFVLYLVKDFRAWTVSNRNKRKRKQQAKNSIIYTMFNWWKRQKTYIGFLKKQHHHQFQFLAVSYESLIFQSYAQLSRMEIFLGLNSTHISLEDRLTKATVHDLFGNRIKNRPEDRVSLTYDDTWQNLYLLQCLSQLLLPAWLLNMKLRKAGGADAEINRVD